MVVINTNDNNHLEISENKKCTSPILQISNNVSINTGEIIDKTFFYQAINFLKQTFETKNDLSIEEMEKISAYFQNVSFLKYLNDYLGEELNSVCQNGNIDIFTKISFLGFLLGKGSSPESFAFSDIHYVDDMLVRNMFFAYESEITKYARIGNCALEQAYIQIYIHFLNFVGIISMLNEMDSDRRDLIQVLNDQIFKTIDVITKSSFIELDQKISNDKGSPTFGNNLAYIKARTGLNSRHLERGDATGIDNMLVEYSELLSKNYQDYGIASQVKFLGKESKKQTLTSAFIANTTTLMFALIEKIEKEKPKKLDELFNHPMFLDKIFQPYVVEMNNAFSVIGGKNELRYENIQNFTQFKKLCVEVIQKNYDYSFGNSNRKFVCFHDIVDDVILILNDLDGTEQIDFHLDYCYQILIHTDLIQGEILFNLANALVESKKSYSYHTESIKLKLLDALVIKMSDGNILGDYLEDFLQQVELYISRNKTNSIILNIYTGLYLTLSYAYSKMSSQKEKALELYFVYEELNTTKDAEYSHNLNSKHILKTLFKGSTVSDIKKDPFYILKHERFVENKWHNTQKKINLLSVSNRIDAYYEALEILSNEFFYGIVEIHIINKDVDSSPKIKKCNGYHEFPIELEYEGKKITHTLLFQYPNNYKENFYKILGESGKIEHISSQIQDIFKKLGLYVLPIHKRIQNTILEALENGEKRCVPYFQPIVGVKGEVTSYECLMRILGTDGKPLLIKDVIGYQEDGQEIVKMYAIDEQLKVANHLGLTMRITQKLLSDVFDIAQKNTEFEFNINLSYDDIMNDLIFQRLKDLSSEYPGVVAQIVIELLENKIHLDSYFDKVKELSDIGYKIAVDDFGSEYNNLSILAKLFDYDIKIHKLKIDQIIIKDIIPPLQDSKSLVNDRSMDKKIIASNIAIHNVMHFVSLAIQYGISGGVVAEYVDNEEVFEILKGLGVEGFQGYMLGKPNNTLEINK